MTVRNPLVYIPGGNPCIQELPAGDTLAGAATGAKGDTGTAGAAATISVGTVTTGAAGSSASVTNSGTSSAAVFDFTIPRGDKGDTGATGAAGTGLVQIAQVVTSGAQSVITFTSIPSGYNALKLICWGRDTATGSGALSARLKINNDTTSGNYTSGTYLAGTGSAAASGTDAPTSAGCKAWQCPGKSSNTNAVGVAEIIIPYYSSTTFYKMVRSQSSDYFTTAAHQIVDFVFLWKSTAAITRLDLTASGTAFENGSIVTLYGMN